VTADAERAAQARREHPGATVLGSAVEMLRTAGELGLGLVVVASPNRTHVPLATAALQRGLPAVVDKPLAATAAEGEQLAALAREHGLILSVFHNRRWDGDFLTLQDLAARGALGTIHRLESRFERWRPQPRPGWREQADPADAGGVLYDLGSHLVDQALQLLGPATHVYAELDRRRPLAEVDDDAFVALTHASGARSHLWMSAVAADLGPRLRALGDKGAYVKHGLDPQEAALRTGARPGDPGWGTDPHDPPGTLPGAYERFYEQLARALEDPATPPPVPAADAIPTLRILDAARASAAAREVVTLEITPALGQDRGT
jgi:predicted dehydrogenase